MHSVLLPLFDTSLQCSIIFNGDFINPFLCCAVGKGLLVLWAPGCRAVSGTMESRCKITIGWNTLGVKKVMWFGQFSVELFALLVFVSSSLINHGAESATNQLYGPRSSFSGA